MVLKQARGTKYGEVSIIAYNILGIYIEMLFEGDFGYVGNVKDFQATVTYKEVIAISG